MGVASPVGPTAAGGMPCPTVPTLHPGAQALWPTAVPRGDPKRKTTLRIDRRLLEEVRELAGAGRFTAVVEEGLRLWLRERGKAPEERKG